MERSKSDGSKESGNDQREANRFENVDLILNQPDPVLHDFDSTSNNNSKSGHSAELQDSDASQNLELVHEDLDQFDSSERSALPHGLKVDNFSNSQKSYRVAPTSGTEDKDRNKKLCCSICGNIFYGSESVLNNRSNSAAGLNVNSRDTTYVGDAAYYQFSDHCTATRNNAAAADKLNVSGTISADTKDSSSIKNRVNSTQNYHSLSQQFEPLGSYQGTFTGPSCSETSFGPEQTLPRLERAGLELGSDHSEPDWSRADPDLEVESQLGEERDSRRRRCDNFAVSAYDRQFCGTSSAPTTSAEKEERKLESRALPVALPCHTSNRVADDNIPDLTHIIQYPQGENKNNNNRPPEDSGGIIYSGNKSAIGNFACSEQPSSNNPNITPSSNASAAAKADSSSLSSACEAAAAAASNSVSLVHWPGNKDYFKVPTRSSSAAQIKDPAPLAHFDSSALCDRNRDNKLAPGHNAQSSLKRPTVVPLFPAACCPDCAIIPPAKEQHSSFNSTTGRFNLIPGRHNPDPNKALLDRPDPPPDNKRRGGPRNTNDAAVDAPYHVSTEQIPGEEQASEKAAAAAAAAAAASLSIEPSGQQDQEEVYTLLPPRSLNVLPKSCANEQEGNLVQKQTANSSTGNPGSNASYSNQPLFEELCPNIDNAPVNFIDQANLIGAKTSPNATCSPHSPAHFSPQGQNSPIGVSVANNNRYNCQAGPSKLSPKSLNPILQTPDDPGSISSEPTSASHCRHHTKRSPNQNLQLRHCLGPVSRKSMNKMACLEKSRSVDTGGGATTNSLYSQNGSSYDTCCSSFNENEAGEDSLAKHSDDVMMAPTEDQPLFFIPVSASDNQNLGKKGESNKKTSFRALDPLRQNYEEDSRYADEADDPMESLLRGSRGSVSQLPTRSSGRKPPSNSANNRQNSLRSSSSSIKHFDKYKPAGNQVYFPNGSVNRGSPRDPRKKQDMANNRRQSSASQAPGSPSLIKKYAKRASIVSNTGNVELKLDSNISINKLSASSNQKTSAVGTELGAAVPPVGHLHSKESKQTQAHASYRLGFRRSLFEKRKKLSDYAMLFSLIGISLMVLEHELSYQILVSVPNLINYSLVNQHLLFQPFEKWRGTLFGCVLVIFFFSFFSTRNQLPQIVIGES